MKFQLPFSKTTAGTVVFSNQADKTLPVNTIYVRKGVTIDGEPIEKLSSITVEITK